jgi:lysyl-tRNA synthetase class 2
MPSTAIRAFSHDRARAALDVTFVTGRRYRYFMVPAYVAEGMGKAFSKGRYFNERIRDRYPFEELPAESEAKARAATARKAASARKVTSPRKGSRPRP